MRNKENRECTNQEDKLKDMASDVSSVIGNMTDSSHTESDTLVPQPENDLENQIPDDDSTRADPDTPDRPGRPSVPTPGKYGTGYGGAPSPGPAPCSAFLPPGFVPPTPPVSSGRPSFIRSGVLRRKCLENSLKSEVHSAEQSQQHEAKKMRLNEKSCI